MSSTTQPYLVEVDQSEKTNFEPLHATQTSLITDCEKSEPICNQLEERTSQAVHTSFPVNLKEVFELTSPNSDINQSLLRQGNDPDSPSTEYLVSSQLLLSQKNDRQVSNGHKQEGNTVLQKLKNREVICVSESDQPIIRQSQLWKSPQGKANATPATNPHGSWTSVLKNNSSGDDDKLNSHTVINLSLGNERVVYRQSSQLQLPATEQSEPSDVDRQRSWHPVTEENSSEDHTSHERVVNHVLNDVCITDYVSHSQLPHSPQIQESEQLVNTNHLGPWSFPSDRGRSVLNHIPENASQPNYGKKDVSCQVDDTSLSPKSDANYQNHPISLTKQNPSPSSEINGTPQNLMNLPGEQERTLNTVPQGVVHDGIKPEMYTQERNLVVEPRLKELSSLRKSGTFPCHRCNKVFCDSRSLQRHIQVHAGARAYHCSVCDKGFMLKGDLTRHIRIHSGEKPYACDVCSRRFTLKGNLMQHFRTHTPEKQYACTICAKNYAQKDSLHRHIRAHFGDKPFQCTICNKRFTLKGDLSRHILIHSGVKPHMCKYCGRMFALKGNLTQHMRIHIKTKASSIEITSKNCDDHQPSNVHNQKTESFQPNLTLLHKLPTSSVSVPNNENTVSTIVPLNSNSFMPTSLPSNCNNQLQSSGQAFCSACSKTFTSPESLQEHVQLIHEQSTHLSVNRYLCNICQKEFALKGDLTRHLNSHNGIKPYQCEQCEKTFTLKSNLRQHQTTHTSEKSFACPLCSKLFGNRRNLSLHLRRHEQASANFTCTRCGRSFLAKSDHFFHNCMKAETTPETSNNDPLTRTSLSATSISTIYHNAVSTDENSEVSQSGESGSNMFEVKREVSQVSCNMREAISNHENLSSSVSCLNGNDSFLSPFYRHLYFATSHQTVLPSLKGFLHSQTEENNVTYNKIVKES